MRHRDVQGIGVVVAHVFPVHRARPQRHAADGLELFELMRGDFVGVGFQHFRDAWAPALDAREHEARVDFHLRSNQGFARDFQVWKGAAVAERREPSFEVIRPGVVGADDASVAMATGSVEKARGAVPAHVVKNPHLAVVAAHGKQHLADEIEHLVVAGIGDLGDVADHLPGRAKDTLAFEREEFRVGVGPGGQAEVVDVRHRRSLHQRLCEQKPVRSSRSSWPRGLSAAWWRASRSGRSRPRSRERWAGR